MTVMAAIGILAERDGGIAQLLFLAVMVVLPLLGWVIQTIKKKLEEQRAEQDRLTGREDGQQPGQSTQQQTPPGRVPQQGPVAEIVQVMREAARQRTAQQQRPAQPPVAPPRREPPLPTIQPVPDPPPPPSARSAQRQVGSLQQRHITPSARGQGASQEADSLRRRLQKKQQQQAKRVSGGHVGRLAVQTQAEAAPLADERIQIQLNAEEVRQGIIYSEILGPPVALRRQAALWNM